MGFLDLILGTKKKTEWTPLYRGIIRGVDRSEIELELGSCTVSGDGFIFWSGSLKDLDDDLPEGERFQISNKYASEGWRGPVPRGDDSGREKWFVVATSAGAIETVARFVGGIPREIEAL